MTTHGTYMNSSEAFGLAKRGIAVETDDYQPRKIVDGELYVMNQSGGWVISPRSSWFGPFLTIDKWRRWNDPQPPKHSPGEQPHIKPASAVISEKRDTPHSSFEMNFFVDRHGQKCVSTTAADGSKTMHVSDSGLYDKAKDLHDYLIEELSK